MRWEKLFALQGFHGASIRDIANAANVGGTLILHHFENKEKLYKAVFALRQDLGQERLRALEAIEDFTAPDALERIVSAFVSPIVKSHATEDGRYYAYCFSVGALVISIFDRRLPRISTGLKLPISVERKTRMLSSYVVGGIRGG